MASSDNIPKASALVKDPEFQTLVRRKNTISNILTAIMLAVYFGFVVLLAWMPDLLSAPAGRATLGIPLGIGVIVVAWILTGVYVRWANTQYDSLIAHIKSRVYHAEEALERNEKEQTS